MWDVRNNDLTMTEGYGAMQFVLYVYCKCGIN